MARKLRIQFPGAIYHIMNRGDRHEDIFRDDTDRESFLQTLADVCKKTTWQVHAFCLMPNHFHFVIEASHHQSLSRFMQWLLTSHVRRYHKHYGSSGHVWQGRFKSFPVRRDEHLLMVLRYVLQNQLDQAWYLQLMTGPGQVRVGANWSMPVQWKSRQTG